MYLHKKFYTETSFLCCLICLILNPDHNAQPNDLNNLLCKYKISFNFF